MRILSVVLVLTWLASWTLPIPAANLARIDRKIAREPAYKSRDPSYILLVFGREAKFRVWLVFDGDDLYLDRKGNGDLTEAGSYLKPSEKADEQGPNRLTIYQVGTLEDPFTKKKYTGVKIDRLRLRPGFKPHNEKEKEMVARLQKQDPQFLKSGFARVIIAGGGKAGQWGIARGSARPSRANILHFDGPLSFALVDEGVLRQGKASTDFRVELVTPGLGNATTFVGHEVAPKGAAPVAEFEFPTDKPGQEPIKTRYTPNGRC